MAAHVIPFTFQQHHPIRATLIEDEPWFCLADVCLVLTVDRTSRLLRDLDEKGLADCHTLTPGGEQQLKFINEPNLYRVIFRSNKPEAKAFQDWVFNEVLPAIRKTGRYVASEVPKPGIPESQWREILALARTISHSCHFQERANSGVHERLRWLGGVPNSRWLPPELFEDAKADLTTLSQLAEQHFQRMMALDEEFIAAVIRPPVSIRKVRALAKRQALQPNPIKRSSSAPRRAWIAWKQPLRLLYLDSARRTARPLVRAALSFPPHENPHD